MSDLSMSITWLQNLRPTRVPQNTKVQLLYTGSTALFVFGAKCKDNLGVKTSDWKQMCVKLSVTSVISLLILLLLAGILLAYYCEFRLHLIFQHSRYSPPPLGCSPQS